MFNKIIYPQVTANNHWIFTVWAPMADQVDLLIQSFDQPISMQKDSYGYWTVETDTVNAGTRYRYRINGKDAFPDPASLSQPGGVHEDSEVIDIERFNWTDNDWKGISIGEMIQYELHTGTFTRQGTFEGVISKLDYLKELGVNTIEIMPVSQFSGHRNWGYDGVYPFAVQDSYGGAFKLMELVNACHNKGMAVILDVVYNHFGPEGNYISNFAPYFTDHYSTPWGSSINFDGEYSDGVRNYFIQNALMWCRDFHFDGLRLDAVHAIYDFGAVHIMQELSEHIKNISRETGREYHLIAESHLNDSRYINPVSKGGYGLTAQWSDDFHHAAHVVSTDETRGYYMDYSSPDALKKALKEAYVYQGEYSEFRKKRYGNSPAENPGKQFVICNQNHDQIGNRKHGERLISLAGFDTAKVLAGATILSPNIPMLFMGEEYGEENPFLYFVSHLDSGLNKLVSEGRKNEFKDFFDDELDTPDPADPGTFDKSKLSWNIQEAEKKSTMLEFYKRLISIRKEYPAFSYPDKDNLKIINLEKLFVMIRWSGDNKVVVMMNFEKHPVTFHYSEKDEGIKKILDSANEKWLGAGSKVPEYLTSNSEINLTPNSIVIFSN